MLPYRLAFLVFINFLTLLSSSVHALPLRARQNAPTTLQTVHTTQTIAGPLTETCVITLTPITDKDGKPAVEEVKQCTLGYARSDDGGGATTTALPGSSGSSTTVGSTSAGASTSTLAVPTSSSVGSSSSATSEIPTSSASPSVTDATSSASVTSSASATSTSTTSGSSVTPVSTTGSFSGLIPHPVSTVTLSPTSTGPVTTSASEASTPAITSTSSSETSAGTPAAENTTNTSTTDQAASAAAASESPEPFQLPGKKLSVLPIGLGVFAGISVIALIVVGLVTYERTKYRKAFRARKLAESGSAMGYGGMAQRS